MINCTVFSYNSDDNGIGFVVAVVAVATAVSYITSNLT